MICTAYRIVLVGEMKKIEMGVSRNTRVGYGIKDGGLGYNK
jgi:hypothetical protein